MNFAVWLSNNLAGGDDGKVKVWSTDTGFCYVTFNEHTAPVSDVYFRPNGNVLLSASLDGTVRAFDLYRYVIKKARDNTLDWACKELHSLTSPHYGATEATLLITLRYNMWQFSNCNLCAGTGTSEPWRAPRLCSWAVSAVMRVERWWLPGPRILSRYKPPITPLIFKSLIIG